jgi:hypothetical protein
MISDEEPAAIRDDLYHASGTIDNPDAQYNPAALTAMRSAEKLLDEVDRLHDRIAELEAELSQARDDAYVISLRSISQGAVVEAAKAYRAALPWHTGVPRDDYTTRLADTQDALCTAVDALSTSQRDRQEAGDGA